jgi:Protein of unknown function (DUF3311)
MRLWYLLLGLPFLGLLYPPLYATEGPELFGFPFFYWYQFAWVPVTAALTYFVYRKTRPPARPAPSRTGRFERPAPTRAGRFERT